MISIIIVTYNCDTVIEKCILSTITEELAETIVIDNASKDQTLMILDSFDKINLIKNSKNLGFSKACNQGIEIAKGEFIFFLNPDAWINDDTLKLLSDELLKSKRIGAVAPKLLYPDETIQNYTRTFPSVFGMWVENFVPKRYWDKFHSYKNYTCQELTFEQKVNIQQPAGAALMFRNQWLLDEHYFIYGSDVDLCKIIWSDNYKISLIPEAIVYHHQSKGGTENPNIRLMLDADNFHGMKYYFLKHREYLNYVMYISLFGASLFLRFLISLFQGKKQINTRAKKLKAFILNQNFQMLYEK